MFEIFLLAILVGNIVCEGARDSTEPYSNKLPGWDTNTEKRLVELEELRPGGPGKDGIPALFEPRFEEPSQAQRWLKDPEPVISVYIEGKAKAYPLQILIWHEIVNDRIGSVPVAVTFCPLCYSANVFDRRVDKIEYVFGVSGMLRYSDMVMYDNLTESLWQQFNGQAIVGDMVPKTLTRIPAQIISFQQFRNTYKSGLVLSRETGYTRDYGRNPYPGYDYIENTPFSFGGKIDLRLKPMEKIIAVDLPNISKAYPYSITKKEKVINDELGEISIVVFHGPGAVSALNHSKISMSREDGSTGVFHRKVDGMKLSFQYINGQFVDDQTQSVWDITGRAISGQLKGKRLLPVVHGDYFAFAWLVFKPQTLIYKSE